MIDSAKNHQGNDPLNSKRHIAIFVPSMRGGGAERVMAVLANWFASHGHTVDLVLAQSEGPYLNELDDAVSIIDLNSSRVAFAFGPLVKYLKNSQPDVMLTALVHANLLGIIARIVARSKTRIVLSERGATSISSDGTNLKPWWSFAIKKLYPKANAITVVSNGVGQELREEFGIDPSLLTTVYNPVDIDLINQLANEGEVDHEWIRDEKIHVFLAVGRLTEVKGFDVLIRAFARIHKSSNSRLIILGDGPLHSELITLTESLGIQDKVAFPGFKSNPFVWMRNSDTFVLSSFSEGLPNALLQAMACRVPVISTNCKHGAAEILDEGKYGHLVPVGDIEQLADAMLASLSKKVYSDVTARIDDFRLDKIGRNYAQALGVPIDPESLK